MAMTLTLVLAPVGLPMLWLANRHRLAVAGTVTRRAERALLGQLSAVLRFHLGLAREPDVDRLLGSGAGRDPFDRQHGAR